MYQMEISMSKCIDCGTETKEGSGSARCPDCWDARCGNQGK
jgi:DNA-directed RNA polymerase subunit RPC12/RpoP